MFTPQYFTWEFEGAFDKFLVRVYDAVTNEQYHGVEAFDGDPYLAQDGDNFTFEVGPHGFNPPNVPDHTDVYFTVQAVIGVDSAVSAPSPVFQFVNFVSTPINLSVE